MSPTNSMTREERKVILASSLGTVFEWYDFFLYFTLAAVLARKFFSALDPTAAFIFALLGAAAGFIVRPFGELVFGRLGDKLGRKHTFLITIVIMGLSTFVVGMLPTADTIGVAAPILLIALRLLQGLALGGEFGGAAVYVAEHAPHHRRGEYTAWIQSTGTLGLFLSILMIYSVRTLLGEDTFVAWGWRLPFLFSIALLGVSVWIRLTMSESPAFARMKAEGRLSTAPLREAFGQWRNLKLVLLGLFGLTAGQAVVAYTGQFYIQFFLTQALKVDGPTANLLVAIALIVGAPFFVLFGWLSDRIGRKPVILGGCLIAALTYMPLFHALTQAANPALARAQAAAQVIVTADPGECSFQGSPIAREIDFKTSCDIAKRFLAQSAVSYDNVAAPAGSAASIAVGNTVIVAPQAIVAGGKFDAASMQRIDAFKQQVTAALRAAGYPEKADPVALNKPLTTIVLFLLVLSAAMVYGPVSAALVELFPTRIRYTAMSLPYHLGNGWFGGLLPSTAFAIVAQRGNMYAGLWYPIVIAAITFVIGVLFVKETKGIDIYRHD